MTTTEWNPLPNAQPDVSPRRVAVTMFRDQQPPRTQAEMLPSLAGIVDGFRKSEPLARLRSLHKEGTAAEQSLVTATATAEKLEARLTDAAIAGKKQLDSANIDFEAAAKDRDAKRKHCDQLRAALEQLTNELRAEHAKLQDQTRAKLTAEALADRRAALDELAAVMSPILSRLVDATARFNSAKAILLPRLEDLAALPSQAASSPPAAPRPSLAMGGK